MHVIAMAWHWYLKVCMTFFRRMLELFHAHWPIKQMDREIFVFAHVSGCAVALPGNDHVFP